MIRVTIQSTVIYALTILIVSSKLIYDANSMNRTKVPIIRFEGKIVGGIYVHIKKFPHAVFLLTKCGNNNMLCGASVVNQKILITAAHCLTIECKDKSIDAYAGHENLDQVTMLRKVSKTVAHRFYDDNTLANDIGLVLLMQALPLSDNVKRVIITRDEPKKVTATVAGWGLVNDVTREHTVLLKSVQQPLCSRSTCSLLGNLHDGMMCAGSVNKIDHRPSKGDSGSGLVTSENQLIGLVSFRNEAYPALLVYTNISFYYDWIMKISKKLYCSDF